MRFVKLFMMVLLLFACQKSEEVKEILVFGHAGMGLSMSQSVYHDNSKEAVFLALNLPTSNGVEVDVRMSKDGTLWLYHDEVLEAETNGTGCVGDLPDDLLKELTYNTFKKERLVKLSDVVPLLQEHQVLFLDIKHMNSCQNKFIDFNLFLEALNEQVSSYSSQIILICSNEYWLNALALEFPVLYSSDDLNEGKKAILNHPWIDGLVMRNVSVTRSDVDWIKKQNRSIYLYDIRSVKGIRQAFRKNPTGILSDDLRNALVERGYAL